MSGEMTCFLPKEHLDDDGIRSLQSLLVTLSMIFAWSFFDRLLLLLCFPILSSVDFTTGCDTGLQDRVIGSDDLLLCEKTVAIRSVGLNSLCETARTDGLALLVNLDEEGCDDAGDDGLAFGMLRIISVN